MTRTRALPVVILSSGLALATQARADLEYGAYLAAECTGCHQTNEHSDGELPRITGWDEKAFVLTMQNYRTGHREHPVMQMIAARLGDTEIAALAAYFATLQ